MQTSPSLVLLTTKARSNSKFQFLTEFSVRDHDVSAEFDIYLLWDLNDVLRSMLEVSKAPLDVATINLVIVVSQLSVIFSCELTAHSTIFKSLVTHTKRFALRALIFKHTYTARQPKL